jgi:hypothetical protein
VARRGWQTPPHWSASPRYRHALMLLILAVHDFISAFFAEPSPLCNLFPRLDTSVPGWIGGSATHPCLALATACVGLHLRGSGVTTLVINSRLVQTTNRDGTSLNLSAVLLVTYSFQHQLHDQCVKDTPNTLPMTPLLLAICGALATPARHSQWCRLESRFGDGVMAMGSHSLDTSNLPWLYLSFARRAAASGIPSTAS